ncbi:MAG: SDR family oxidoreductase [Deltaproteobacteria bacterium]|nr:SDR family oxidoreductase [Deltaproteobacteria bacterium]
MVQPIVLVTGATGFVGGAVAASLLRAGTRLVFLVRGDDARRRVAASVTRFAESADDAAAIAQATTGARVLIGDLRSMPRCPAASLGHVTHVVHAAACTSFRSTRTVHVTNVEGTAALMEVLRRCRSLERVVHVSTAYACGRVTAAVVREDVPLDDADHPAEYSRSKARAERMLRAEFGDLPIVVARPSAVDGHSRLGCAPSSSLFWYYRALATMRLAPFGADTRRDIVPVDWVDAALRALLFAPSLAHRLYHVSAGVHSSAPWRAIATALQAPPNAPLRVAAPESIADDPAELARVFGRGDVARLSRALTSCARFGVTGAECFDNSRLLAERVAPPPPFTAYADRCLATTAGRSMFALLDDDA